MTKDQESKIVSDVAQKVSHAESFLSGYTDNWERYYKHYRSFIDDAKWPTHTKIYNPQIWSAIETQTSKLVSQKPSGEFVADDKGSKQGESMRVGLWFDDAWRKDRMGKKQMSTFKKALRYGSAIGRAFWLFELGWELGKRKVTENRPSFRLGRLEDKMFGFDPEADDWDTIRWAYERYYMSKTDFENLKASPMGAKLINLDEIIRDFESGGYESNATKDTKISVSGSSTTRDTTVKKVECIYLENYETGDFTITVGKKHLAMVMKNPYPFKSSFIFVVDNLVDSEVLGMGEVEPVERLAHELNLVESERRDNVHSILKNQWIVGDSGNVDDDELVDEMNGIIHASDVNQVKPFFKPNVTASSYQESIAIKNDIAAALAVTSASKGSTMDLETQKSGKALEALMSATDARVATKLQLFEIMFVKEIAEKWQGLASIYMTDTVTVEDGGRYITITPNTLKKKFKYHVESGSTKHTDRDGDQKSFVEYLNFLLTLADRKVAAEKSPGTDESGVQIEAPEPIINYDKLAEKLSEKYNVKDWKEFWMMAQKNQGGNMLPDIDGDGIPDSEEQQPQPQPQEESITENQYVDTETAQ